MPYLFSTAVETHKTGVPTMRAMVLEFEEDNACL
jgi:Alpha-glucosidases, family 31 of glycosyl hydrolases